MTSNLPVIPLAEIVMIKGGKRLPAGKNLQTIPSNHPYIRVRDVGQRGLPREGIEYVPDDVFPSISRYIVQRNDVVLSIVGTIGALSIVDSFYDYASLTENCVKLTGLDYHDALYLYYYLSSSIGQQEISQGTVGAVQPKLPIYNIEKIKVLWPDDKNRRKNISTVLGKLDDKIDLNRRINQTLEAMVQAIFKSWFVDFDPVKAKIAAKQEGRDPLRAAMSAISGKPDAELDALPPEQFDQLAATAALFPDEMEESELGEIPRGWSFAKIETLLSRLSAKVRYTKEQVSEYGQIPVFEQGASILFGYHGGVASYQATSDNPMFIFGDHTCVTRLSCQPFDISQNVIPLQGQDRATAWVYYAVKEKQKFQEYRRHWMELISKDVLVATADICLEFSKRITSLHLQIEANERQTQSLRELRNTLLPKLLSGDLSVTEAMAETEA